ncbi:MAG TPA: helix-turn-helix domain-containing protein [Candidatus Angelobacter sp.]|nr:helix-turn-helix domain-containing protein [Candidatus Angelobacter sp.]
MRFHKEFNSNPFSDDQLPIHKPVPMQPKDRAVPDDSDTFANIRTVARLLNISPRHVQRLAQRKVIPVIRLGRRCTRFDIEAVIAAVRKYQLNERGR